MQRGMDLKPYWKNASFADECVGCHTPMRANDFAFTAPPLAGESASIAQNLPFNPFQWEVVSSGVDPRDGTMATLCGNDVAARAARESSRPTYPAGSVLSLVTWNQRADDHWFGARVPGEIKSVEFVSVEKASRSYQAFSGSPLRKVAFPESRIDSIVDLRASTLP